MRSVAQIRLYFETLRAEEITLSGVTKLAQKEGNDKDELVGSCFGRKIYYTAALSSFPLYVYLLHAGFDIICTFV